MMKAWINPYRAMTSVRNGLGLSVDEQTQIPPRRPLDETSASDPALGKVLGMKPHIAYSWDVDARPLWRCEGIRKRDARQLVALALESGFLRQLLVAALPRQKRRVEHTLQRMTGDAELFAVIGQQIMKGFLAVIDAIFGILFDFADGPIPDTCKLEQPGVKLAFLRYIETKLELSLDHLTPAFDVRCIA